MTLSSRFGSTGRPRGARPEGRRARGKLQPTSSPAPSSQQVTDALVRAVAKEVTAQLREELERLLAPIREKLGVEKAWRFGDGKSYAGLDARLASIQVKGERQVKNWVANLPPIVRARVPQEATAGPNGPMTEMGVFAKSLADMAQRAMSAEGSVPGMTRQEDTDAVE